MTIIDLIIEEDRNSVSGRIEIENALIVEDADNLPQLEEILKRVLLDEYQMPSDEIEFNKFYDLTAFYYHIDRAHHLPAICKLSGIGIELGHDYVSKEKFPPESDARKLKMAIIEIMKLDVADSDGVQ
ncbi:hypothetical protein SAMN05428988_3174 [Chitinophaga sp. YR573]|uniref:hypothetical protein n=1 Tax=Chitinophaga sp. YR573 TaxID=1881040 RepID=UPI0008B41E9F|nr:hypothetical protein [Chitinophaga sp. YR573]SEW21117.1 hypothetical protein SAMN05428988_3174 [Chitinophaga sp. YR573]